MSKQNVILVTIGVIFGALYVAQLSGVPTAEAVHPLWNATIAVFLICIGAFGIENAKKFKLRLGDRFSVGIETERYEPTPKEEAQAIAVSQDALTPEQEQEALELRRQAEARKQGTRSAADFLVLSTEAWRSKNFDAAVSLAQHGRSLGPSNSLAASLTQRMATAYYELGATRHAEKLFRQAIALAPTLTAPRNNLGNLLNDTERLDEAEAEFRMAISLEPGEGVYHYNLGNLLRDTERLDEAEAEFRMCISMNPGYAKCHWNLSILLKDAGRLDEANAERRKAVSLDPSVRDRSDQEA